MIWKYISITTQPTGTSSLSLLNKADKRVYVLRIVRNMTHLIAHTIPSLTKLFHFCSMPS